jgi:hypothetical protein
MGVVFRARDPQLDRVVAIKQLIAGAAAHPEHRERFLTEARAIAQLDHRHIVPIYDFDLNAGQPFFVMKYLEGGSLSQKRAELAGDTRAVVTAMAKVTRAVQHAHEHKILHRDLKPSNILLDEQGEPMVGDFGLAKLLYAGDDLTYTGVVLGTPTYMSPEQRAGRVRDLGFGCDIWALGITLRELVTGARGNDSGAKLEVTPANSGNPSGGGDAIVEDRGLAAIIEHCLQHEPADRYPTAAALADDLEQWLRGQFVAPRPRISRSRRAFLIAGTGALLALGGGAGIWARYYRHMETQRRLIFDLALNGRVDLLGPEGNPIWSDVRAGNPVIRTEMREDGPVLLVSGGKRAMIDLLPSTGQEEITLHGQVQMMPHKQLGWCEVGIYAGRSSFSTKHSSNVECCVRVGVRRNNPAPATNLSQGERDYGLVFRDTDEKSQSYAPDSLPENKKDFHHPLEHWHDFELALGPSGLDGSDLPVNLPHLNRTDLSAGAAAASRRSIAGAPWPQMDPHFRAEEALGIYVENGMAAFRQLWLENKVHAIS